MEPDLWQEYLNERSTVIVAESGCIDVEVLIEAVTFYWKASCVNYEQSDLRDVQESSLLSMESQA